MWQWGMGGTQRGGGKEARQQKSKILALLPSISGKKGEGFVQISSLSAFIFDFYIVAHFLVLKASALPEPILFCLCKMLVHYYGLVSLIHD